jgi:hypothetical protein
LNGVVGRQAGTVPGYNYSEPNKNSGLVWDEATLAKYLENPQAVVKGTKMAFPGVHDPQKVASIIAFLKQYGTRVLPHRRSDLGSCPHRARAAAPGHLRLRQPGVTEAADAVPVFNRGFRLRHDDVRGTWVVLAPERLFLLDGPAAEVLVLG